MGHSDKFHQIIITVENIDPDHSDFALVTPKLLWLS